MFRRIVWTLAGVVGLAFLSAPCWAGAEYVGSKSCKKCHMAEYKSWEKMSHANALSILEPGKSTEAKEKHGLDVNKDYTKEDSCLACHTVGFGQGGGYFMPDAADEKTVKEAEKLAGVGCESCHGPGGEYLAIFEDIKKSKRMYKLEELTAAGLVLPDEAACKTCHNEKSPTYDTSNPFDFAKMKDEGVHEHKELKQREE